MSRTNGDVSRVAQLERELFAMAHEDGPPKGARERLLVSLGMGVAVGVATGAAAGGVGASSGALGAGALASATATLPTASLSTAAPGAASIGVGAMSGSAATAGLLTATKWAAVGIVAGTLTVGGSLGALRLTSPAPEVPMGASGAALATAKSTERPRATTAPSLAPAGTIAVAPEEPPSHSDNAPPVVAQAAARTPPQQTAPSTIPAPPAAVASQEAPAAAVTSAPKSSLSEEVVRIDEARSALASGNPARAVAVLDAYVQRFPEGRMRPEATAVRVEALVQLGREGEARALAHPFIAAHPADGLSVRMRKVLGE